MRAFPGVVFGESPLKVVGMAPVEFTGRFKRFENVSVIHGILKDGLPSVARNCASGSERRMVEAAGIEPASQVNLPAATTCLVQEIFSAMRWRLNTSRTA